MKKKNWGWVAAIAYGLLFGYSLWAKISDFKGFRSELEQSPLPPVLASLLTRAVPVSEFLVIALICFPRSRPYGLAFGQLLLACFCGWLGLVIWQDAPSCACGGWLEHLRPGWHLALNIFFITIGLPSGWPLYTFLCAQSRRHPGTG